MNRLILIGNGFDLAHGLKTSYNDFILWYLKKCYFEGFERHFYEDPLLQITRNFDYKDKRIYDFDSVIEFIEEYYQQGFTNLGQNVPFKGNDYASHFPFYTNLSSLMRSLLENCSNTRWVDIEGEFYDRLKFILKRQDSNAEKKEDLIVLNKSLEYLIGQLKSYLKSQKDSEYNEAYMQIFTSKILKSDVHGIELEIEEEPRNTLMLNFNYTDTLKPYTANFYRRSKRPVPAINHIHGHINEELNPPIFGFGDELDEAYLQMERERIREYFVYIKSFWYFRTSNYRDLTRFIDSDDYQILVIGHSCGLSDRTMLHMLFEHPNCKSIKIYYHGDKEKNNFTDVTYDIARHFKHKGEMRNKIVSLDLSESMPPVEPFIIRRSRMGID